MKRTLLFFLSCFTATILFAQSQVTVKGQLTGPTENDPLPYATISVSNETSPQVAFKKLATDEKGNFTVALPAGKYVFSFNYVGMNVLNKDVDVSADKSPMDLGKILMTESSTQLGEVSVVAQKPLVKVEIDKLTYSAKDDPEARTSSVLDLLRKVPMVTVDGDENIQLKGSSNYKIYLNGKPSTMISSNPSQVLKSMPANSIKDIEVITDPGAKYDAEGVGRTTTIITEKKVDEGINGPIGPGAGTRGDYNANMYLTVKHGKWGFTGNGSYYVYNMPGSEYNFHRRDFSRTPETILDQLGTSKNSGMGNFISGLVSYELDTLNLFSVSVNGYTGKGKNTGITDVASTGGYDYTYKRTTGNTRNYGSRELSADYQRSFSKKGKLLTMSYKYSYDPNGSEGSTVITDTTGVPLLRPEDYKLKNVNDANGKEHTAQVDYVDPITKNHTVEAGLKYIFRDNSSFTGYQYWDFAASQWKEDIARKNDLVHNQYIASAYGSYGYKTDKFGLKAGLRAEQTQQNINFISQNDSLVKTKFFDMVPSLTLSYQLSMTKTLRLGYNMRVYRPGIWYLNPYVNNTDPLNVSYGNPNLDAEKNHNISLNYGSFSQKFNLNASLNYSLTNNAITSYQFMKDGVNHSTYDNIGKSQSIGLNGYVNWRPITALNIYMNTNVDYIDIRSSKDPTLKNNGFSFRAFSGVTYTLPKDLRLSFNAGYFGNRVELQTNSSAFYFTSFGVTKSFFEKKLDISLRGNSPFSKYREFKSTTTGANFEQNSVFKFPMRSLNLSVSYRFGDLKSSVKRVQRGINNDDVKSGGGDQNTGGAGGVTTGS